VPARTQPAGRVPSRDGKDSIDHLELHLLHQLTQNARREPA
jgi:hypothetical protein